MTDYKGIKTFDQLIEREHGKIGTDSRNEYEENARGNIQLSTLIRIFEKGLNKKIGLTFL